MKHFILSRRVLAAVVVGASAAMTIAGVASANGVTGPAFYVDGQLYRTVGTATDFSRTRAPDHSFDVIYDFGGLQKNVATAAPGDPGYNGGRWHVHALSFPNGYSTAVAAHDSNGSGNLDSDEEIGAAIAEGDAADLGIVKSFECPVIKLPMGKNQ